MTTVIQSYARTTLVAMVMKTGKLEHRIGYNTVCSGDIYTTLVLWHVLGVS